MKLGELKIQALKLMFANGADDIGVDTLPELMGSERYAPYLSAICGSLNRCFADLENKRILPLKRVTLTLSDGACGFWCCDTEKAAPDCGTVERVVYCNSDGVYEPYTDCHAEGSTLVFPKRGCDNECYTLLYRPRLPRVFPYTDNGTELAIPDNVAEFIPYFLKSELFREDEVNEAAEARNIYEQQLAAVADGVIGISGSVGSAYALGGGEL